MLDMATIHITRAEAVRDIDALLEKAAAGMEIVIESEASGPPLILERAYSETLGSKDSETEAWLRRETDEGLREADDPKAVWVSNKEANAQALNLRAEILARSEAKAS